MINTTGHELIEVWNVKNGVLIYAAAQPVLNILGRVNNAEIIEKFIYSLNGRSEVPVFFRNSCVFASRLARHGDFNIDTITRDQLHDTNQLKLIARLKDGTRVERSYVLAVNVVNHQRISHFTLNLSCAEHPQEVGQLVDGKWRIGRDERGQAFLEIRPEDAGLDRIILFGTDDMQSGYTIRARLEVTQWRNQVHNVGLLFQWNPHLQGDGTCLPSRWTTGLGYFYSHCPGLRIRIGVDVHLNKHGEKVGDNILGEAVLSNRRYWTNRIVRKITQGRCLIPQIVPGIQYWFEMRVDAEIYALTVWPVDRYRPFPQVVVNAPPDLLTKGAVGIIAHYCAVRVFEFLIEPQSESKAG